MKASYHYSGDSPFAGFVLGTFVVVLWIGAVLAVVAPFIVHVVVCVKANWAAMLIIGLVVPPVGWIHGVGIILGFWG